MLKNVGVLALKLKAKASSMLTNVKIAPQSELWGKKMFILNSLSLFEIVFYFKFKLLCEPEVVVIVEINKKKTNREKTKNCQCTEKPS